MTAINFPANPSNGDTHQGFVYNSTLGVWQSAGSQTAVTSFTGLSDTPSALGTAGQIAKVNSGATALEFADQSGVTVYANVDALPSSGNAGDLAFVSGTNRLYIWNGSGWYNIALINTNPTISGVSANYDLATDGTATTVTITATDPEGLPITYSIASDTSGNTATVTQGTGANINVFTITPSTNDADAGTFSLTFRASDGVNIASAISEFTLQFLVQNSNYTTALITSVGTNNQVNNDFVDSSTNSHTITAAGNATQTTFSPYRHGGYSIFCDGVNVMDLGFSTLNSGNWTFECWARVEAGDIILGKFGGGNQLEGFGVHPTTGYMYTHTNVGVETPTCNTDLRDGKWHYLVWERYNGTYYYWADGSLETSFANSETPGATGNWVLGGVASSRFKGNIKEARFSLSTAVYSGSAPTTPTEPQTTSNATDAFFTGVGLEIKDYSSNNKTFTVPSTFESAPTTPYDYTTYSAGANGGSMYFDGTSDYLTIPSNSDFTLDGDFTIECWFYSDGGQVVNYPSIISSISFNTTSFSLRYNHTGYNNKFFVAKYGINGSGGSNSLFAGTINVPYNTWAHVALVRSGTTCSLYVNGELDVTTTDSTDFDLNQGSQGTAIGGGNWDGAAGSLKGNISNLRVVKGTAVYTSSFTPPTAPLTAITNTSLLLSGTNVGIIDKSQSVKSITLNGDTKSSTTQTKYLTTSMYFDGTGDYLQMDSQNVGNFGTLDFTAEGWIYLLDNNALYTVVDGRPSTLTSASGWSVAVSTSGELYIYSGGFLITGASSAVTPNNWHHWAYTRENGTHKLFLNGTQAGSSSTASRDFTAQLFRIGASGTGGELFKGYQSDVRITKGLARYTANFTPPTAALQG